MAKKKTLGARHRAARNSPRKTTKRQASRWRPPTQRARWRKQSDLRRNYSAHREIHDIFWCAVLSELGILFFELMLDYAVYEPIHTGTVPKAVENRYGRPDSVAFCSHDPKATWRATLRAIRKLTGEIARFTLANVEAKKDVRPDVDREQMFHYKTGLRTRYGLLAEIQQRIFATGDERPDISALLVEGAGYGVPEYSVPIIWRGDLHADRVPQALYDHPVGAIAVLLLPHGDTLEHVLHAFRLWLRQPRLRGGKSHFWLFTVAAQIEPKLVKLYEQAEDILEEEAMANGAVNVAKENWQQIRNLVTAATDVFDEHELDAVPRIRQRFKSGIEQGIERGIKQGVKQGIEQGVKRGVKQGIEQGVKRGVKQGIEQGVKQGVKQGIEQGASRQRIDDLLELLQRQSIRLTQTQEARLRKLTNGELPELGAALDATSATDFMRRAGLLGRTRTTRRRRATR